MGVEKPKGASLGLELYRGWEGGREGRGKVSFEERERRSIVQHDELDRAAASSTCIHPEPGL